MTDYPAAIPLLAIQRLRCPRSNEIRGCWLVRWRTTAAYVGHASARRCRKAQIENT